VWNGSQLALKRATTTRIGPEEEHGLDLTYAMNDYFHAVAMRKVLASPGLLPDEERERMRAPVELGRFADPAFYTSCGVHIGIITTDAQLIFLRRSKHVNQSRSDFTCGAVEGMSHQDIDPRTGVPCPFRAAVRALEEEVHIVLARSDDPGEKEALIEAATARVHLLGLICKPVELQWGFVGYVDLREPQTPEYCRYSSEDVATLFRLHVAKDKFEHDSFMPIPLMVEPVLHFLQQRRESVVPSAVACALFILFDLFDEHNVLLTAVKQ
jgi:hypothetical protein